MKLEKNFTKILLLCGILSSLLYIGTDLLASWLYEGYSYTSQQISELAAIGAPTRLLWIAMTIIWAPLVVAFGTGVLLSARKLSLKWVGILLAIWSIIGLVWLFFPMHQRGTVQSETDTLHILFAAVQVIVMVLFISLGAVAIRGSFRVYSIITIIVLLSFGALVSTQASAIAVGQSTPFMGIVERVSVYSPIIWVLVLSTNLLRAEKKQVSI